MAKRQLTDGIIHFVLLILGYFVRLIVLSISLGHIIGHPRHQIVATGLTLDRMGMLGTWFTQFASASAITSDGRTCYHKILQNMRKYLLMHCCHQRVLQTQEVSLDEWRIASKLSSEGPFLNHHSFHWGEG